MSGIHEESGSRPLPPSHQIVIVPSITVTAPPVRTARSSASLAAQGAAPRARLMRGEAGDGPGVRPTRGVSTAWAPPVTGSSSMPAPGTNTRPHHVRLRARSGHDRDHRAHRRQGAEVRLHSSHRRLVGQQDHGELHRVPRGRGDVPRAQAERVHDLRQGLGFGSPGGQRQAIATLRPPPPRARPPCGWRSAHGRGPDRATAGHGRSTASHGRTVPPPPWA